MSARLERLVNLTATLLAARRPLTLDEITERLEPPYPSDKIARRRQFERDKETLRDLGIPVTVQPVDPLGGEAGYLIHPQDYYLPDPGLDAEERAALHVAVTAVRFEEDAARAGLGKLGGAEGVDAAPLAMLTPVPALPGLFEAVTRRAPVSFAYQGAVRRLHPYGVVHRHGHWYVVGHDPDREAHRAFRVDRIDGLPELGAPGSFEPPEGIEPATLLRSDPLAIGEDEPVEAHVLVDDSRAEWVLDQLGEDALVTRNSDGSAVIRLSVVNRTAFRSFVLGLLEHAEVLEPPALRSDLVGWLETLAHAGDRSDVEHPR